MISTFDPNAQNTIQESMFESVEVEVVFTDELHSLEITQDDIYDARGILEGDIHVLS